MDTVIKNRSQLKEAIEDLNKTKTIQEEILLDELHNFYENIKPLNLLKNTFQEAAASPDVRSNLLKGAVGIGAGILSKNILIGGGPAGLAKKALGNALKFGVAALVTKNAEKIKSTGSGFISRLFKKAK